MVDDAADSQIQIEVDVVIPVADSPHGEVFGVGEHPPQPLDGGIERTVDLDVDGVGWCHGGHDCSLSFSRIASMASKRSPQYLPRSSSQSAARPDGIGLEPAHAEASPPPPGDQACSLEHIQMLGHGRLSEIEVRRQFQDATVSSGEDAKHLSPRRVSQRTKREIEIDCS